MTSVFKEYSFVAVSVIGAVVFFVAWRWLLAYKNESSIVRMMDNSLQYGDVTDTSSYGRDSLDASLANVNASTIPYIKIADSKDYHVENTYKTEKTGEVDAENKEIETVPATQVLTWDFIMKDVSVGHFEGGNFVPEDVDNIQLTVIDYTPALDLKVNSNQNTISGKAYNENVIAVDKFGNRKLGTETDGYKMTERLAFEQREPIDSKTLAADEYNEYYGTVHFYKNGTWYKDNGNGAYDNDTNIDEIEPNGVEFSTDIPHKFKVIYRVTGTASKTESQSLKSEVTKIFIAKPRKQTDRSIAVYKNVYEKKILEGEGVPEDLSPESVEASMSDVDDYSGLTGDQVINNAVQDKLNRVRTWQAGERAKEEDKEGDEDVDEDSHQEEPAPSEEPVQSEETSQSEESSQSEEPSQSNDDENGGNE